MGDDEGKKGVRKKDIERLVGKGWKKVKIIVNKKRRKWRKGKG